MTLSEGIPKSIVYLEIVFKEREKGNEKEGDKAETRKEKEDEENCL